MGGLFDLAGKEAELAQMEEQTLAGDFWQDAKAAQALMQRLNDLKEQVKGAKELFAAVGELSAMWELAREEDDEPLAEEAAAELRRLQKRLEAAELTVLLSGAYDDHSAVISLHAGAGGVEAQDWVEMLLRM
ncbi:MAG: PCRF domain-containing protein, partial [Clostridiales bacterium]|nr:PCRF domain-containing protein [Clostridiales bacterium]